MLDGWLKLLRDLVNGGEDEEDAPRLYIPEKPKEERPPLPVQTQSSGPIGWRAWSLYRYEHTGPILGSIVKNYLWGQRRVMNAEPPMEGDPFDRQQWSSLKLPVEARDAFGFYTHKELEHIESYLGESTLVLGQVRLLGTIIEHEHGYRAQGCEIAKLRVYPGGWIVGKAPISVYSRAAPAPWYPYGEEPSVLDALRERYGCEVEFVGEMPEGMEQRGLRTFQSVTTAYTMRAGTFAYPGKLWSSGPDGLENDIEPEEESTFLYKPEIKKPSPEEIQDYGA